MLRRAMKWTTQQVCRRSSMHRRGAKSAIGRPGTVRATSGPVRDGQPLRYDDVTTARGSPAFDVTFRCRATHAITDA